MKKIFCILACVFAVISLVACSTSGTKDESLSNQTTPPTTPSPTVTHSDITPSAPNNENDTAIASILSFVEKFNAAADESVCIAQPSVEKQNDGTYAVSGTNGITLVIRLDPNENVVLVSPVSDDIPEKLSVAKTVMLLLQGKTLLPEEKQAIIDNTKATIDAISAEIDAAWENAQDTELDTNLPDYSSLKTEAARISEEIQNVKNEIAGG